MASICSVTFMDPSSLAIPLELRPATIKPVSTGPSSRTMESETSLSGQRQRTELLQRAGGLQRQNRAGEEAGQHDDGQRAYPDLVGLHEGVGKIAGAGKDVGQGAAGEQGIVLHRLNLFLRKLCRREDGHAVTEISYHRNIPEPSLDRGCWP